MVEGIIKKAPATTKSKEFYIAYKPVVKQSTETTKLQIVYDVSAKPTKTSPFLIKMFRKALQNLRQNVLTRCRLKPVAITGDLKSSYRSELMKMTGKL